MFVAVLLASLAVAAQQFASSVLAGAVWFCTGCSWQDIMLTALPRKLLGSVSRCASSAVVPLSKKLCPPGCYC
jgi:hypothetical protein